MNRVDFIKSRFAKYGLILLNWQVSDIARWKDIEPPLCEKSVYQDVKMT